MSIHRCAAAFAVATLLLQHPLHAQTPADSAELAALRAAAAGVVANADTGSRPASTSRGGNALNPELTLTGDFRFANVSPGPARDHFSAREFEIGIQSALDPYSTAKISIAFEDGEAAVEEGYVYFTSLPWHLRLDLGQFRQQVGELNRWHLHALALDEYPLVVRRFAGEEGLAGAGASIYWPLPFSGKLGTFELTLQATSGTNEVLFAESGRPAVNAQLSGFWQLSRSTFAQVSVSALHGTAPDTSLTTDLATVAARFTWRPPQRSTSRELTLRSELWSLKRKFADIDFDTRRLGGYAEASWRLDRRWVAAVRGDWVESPEPGPVADEWAIAPSLTYWQSEFVYLRGVYERARSVTDIASDRLSLQVVYAMGPHKHEQF
jgi:hypothetical protein